MTGSSTNAYLPLTPLQEALLTEWEAHEGPDPYVLQVEALTAEELDAGRLSAALGRVLEAEPALRACFRRRASGEPVQVIPPAAAPDVRTVPGEDGGDEDARWERVRRLDAEAGHDLRRGPAIRLHVGPSRSGGRVLVSVHHIVADGWSLVNLTDRILRTYRDPQPVRPPALADSALVRHLEWTRARPREDAVRVYDALFADGAFEGTVSDMSTVSPEPDGQEELTLEADVVAALRRRGEADGLTLHDMVVAAWGVALAEVLDVADVALGTVDSGRDAPVPGMTEAVGMFASVCPVAVRTGGDTTVGDVVRGVRAQQHATLGLRHVGLVGLAREVPAMPGVDTVVTFQGYRSTDLGEGVLEARAWARNTQAVTLTVVPGDRLVLSVAWDRGRVSDLRARCLTARLSVLLRGLPSLWDTPVGKLDRAGAPGAATEPAAPASPLLGPALVASAARHADRVAVVDIDGRPVCYAELFRGVHRMARRLASAGVGPGVVVAVDTDRTLPGLTALLGVIVSGGAFYVVDRRSGTDVLQGNFAELGPAVVVTTAEHDVSLRPAVAAAAATGVPVLHMDASALDALAPDDDGASPADEWLAARHAPDEVQDVFFTSGSTGRPKGVMVPKRAMGAVADVYVQARGLTPEAVVAGMSDWCFDIGPVDFLSPLLSGARYLLTPTDVVLDPPRAGALLQRHRATHVQATPTYLTWLAEHAPGLFAGLNTLSAGEILPRGLARRLQSLGAEVLNGYGPTETTVISTLARLGPEDEVTIGSPVGGDGVEILDRRLRRVPPGAQGEIHLRGPGVAHGYVCRPALTAARFIADPYGPPGSVLYRTGDLGAWSEDGRVRCLGRNDGQVKVRGHRVECASVEAALMDLDGVREAVVAPQRDARGLIRLLGFAVAPGRDAEGLREELVRRLPPHEVPARLQVLDAFPTLTSGKVDRLRLLKEAEEAEEGPVAAEEAGNAGTAALRTLFAEALGLEAVGDDDDLYYLGGDSIVMAHIAARIQQEHGVWIPLARLMELRTPAAIQAAVDREAAAGEVAAAAPPPAPVPLSANQAAMWFLEQLTPGQGLYNVSVAFDIAGDWDPDALVRAVDDVVLRHPALHSLLDVAGGAPTWRAAPERVSGLLAERRHADAAELTAALHEEGGRDVVLTRELPFRATLHRAPGIACLQVVVHHAAVDGMSLGVLAEDLSAAYAARRRGRTPGWDPAPGPHAHLAVLAGRDPSVRERSVDHWRTRLADAPAVSGLPHDVVDPPAGDPVGLLEHAFGPLTAEAARTLADRGAVSRFAVLTWALFEALRRGGAGQDLVLGVPVSGRTTPESLGQVGCFVNTLPLRSAGSGPVDVGESVAALGRTLREDLAHQDVAFSELVEVLAPARRPGSAPLVQAGVAMRLPSGAGLLLEGAAVRERRVDPRHPRFEIFVEFAWEDGEPLTAHVEYDRRLYREATVRGLLEGVEQALRDAGGAGPEAAHTAPAVLEDLAARVPARPAVEDWSDPDLHGRPRTVTFEELGRAVSAASEALAGAGAGPGDVVVLRLPRGLALVVHTLAVACLGAAVVVVDPRHPVGRLYDVLADTGARHIVADDPVPGLAEDVRTIEPRSSAAEPGPGGGDPARLAARFPGTPGTVAAVVFTSGTTGRPKGVMLTHGALLQIRDGLGSAGWHGRSTQLFGLGFDAFLFDLVVSVLSGGTLCLPPEGATAGEPLARHLRAARPDRALMTPSQAATLPPLGEELDAEVLLGGEKVRPQLVRALHRAGFTRGARNMYGPTEGTIIATWSDALPDDGSWPTAGRPLDGRTVHVLDDMLRPVPPGEAGEIHLGGVGVAPGYLGDPARTAARFVAAPGGERMYRTGDLGMLDELGRLHVLGRRDRQVKVDGQRIELAEIEEVLCRHPGVTDAVVVARQTPAGHTTLLAWVAGPPEADLAPGVLRAHAGDLLPAHMVPSRVSVLAALPRTVNGKVATDELPDSAGGTGHEPPANGHPVVPAGASHGGGTLPTRLRRALGEVLDAHDAHPEDTFSGLGGSSLAAVRLAALLPELEVPFLMADPTVGALAERLQDGSGAASRGAAPGGTAILDPVIVLNERGAQAPLFLFHSGTGLAVSYAGMAPHLGPEVPLVLLQAPALDRTLPLPEDLPRLVAELLATVRRQQPTGPYRLMGWSFGRWAAHEAARQLEASGDRVELLVVVDALVRTHEPGTLGTAEVIASFARTVGLTAAGDAPPGDVAALHEGLRALGPKYAGVGRADVERLAELMCRHHDLVARHRPGVVAAPTLLVLSSSSGTGHPQAEADAWRPLLSGRLTHVSVGAAHDDLMQETPRALISGLVARLLSADGPAAGADPNPIHPFEGDRP